MTRRLRVVCVVVALAIVLGSAAARALDEGQEGWRRSLAFYVTVGDAEGTATVRGFSSAADTSFSEILDDLEYGTQIHFEAAERRWGVVADLTVVALAPARTSPPSQADVDQVFLDLVGTCSLTRYFQLAFGGRYVSLSNEIKIQVGNGFRIDQDADWVDPIVGGRLETELGPRWVFSAAADVGGFGVESDFIWNVATLFAYRATPKLSLVTGYRVVQFDFEEGTGPDRFEFDVRISGALLAMAYHF